MQFCLQSSCTCATLFPTLLSLCLWIHVMAARHLLKLLTLARPLNFHGFLPADCLRVPAQRKDVGTRHCSLRLLHVLLWTQCLEEHMHMYVRNSSKHQSALMQINALQSSTSLFASQQCVFPSCALYSLSLQLTCSKRPYAAWIGTLFLYWSG